MKGRLRELRDGGCCQGHIIIWELYLVHQVINLLLVLSLGLVEISHHDRDLSGEVDLGSLLLRLLTFGTSAH